MFVLIVVLLFLLNTKTIFANVWLYRHLTDKQPIKQLIECHRAIRQLAECNRAIRQLAECHRAIKPHDQHTKRQTCRSGTKHCVWCGTSAAPKDGSSNTADTATVHSPACTYPFTADSAYDKYSCDTGECCSLSDLDATDEPCVLAAATGSMRGTATNSGYMCGDGGFVHSDICADPSAATTAIAAAEHVAERGAND